MKFALQSITVLAFILGGSLNLSVAQTEWTGGNGNWENGVNWNTGTAPGPGENVVIDQGGGFTITVGDTISAINSLNSVENLLVDGDDLELANGGATSGSFTLGTNRALRNNGGVFSATGTTVLDGGNVFANSGATINFNNVANYVTDTGTNLSRTLEANNGSTLNFAGLNTIEGGTFVQTLRVNSLGNSQVDMSALTNITDAVQFLAEGAGSTIDVSNLATFNHNVGLQSGFRAVAGGRIDASSLTAFAGNTSSSLVVDGATSSLDVSSLTSLTNVNVEFENGGSTALGGVTDITGSSFSTTGGDTIDLTGATSYDVNGGTNNVRIWEANGTGSTIDASSVTTATAGTFIRVWDVDAANGASVDLSSLTEIVAGAATFNADGGGSLIDLSALQTFNNTGATISSIEATSGGEVRLDTSASSNLDFNRVDVIKNVGATLDTSRLVTFDNGTFTSNGVSETLNITSSENSSFIANDGAVLDVSSLTGAQNSTAGNFTETKWAANGVGSAVDLSNVTSITSSTSNGPEINLEARDGGELDLSGVQTIDAPAGLINAIRAVNVVSDGINSLVQLNQLTSFSDVASNTDSSITASNGGIVNLLMSGQTDLTNITTTVENDGVVNGGDLELLSVFTPTTGSPLDDLSVIQGDGFINANVLNTSGVIRPGISGAGTLTIGGNFIQTTDGLLELEIDDLGISDMLLVTGDVALGGDFSIAIDGAFDLVDGATFEVLDVGGTSMGMFNGLAQNSIVASDNGLDLRINYFGGDGNDVELRVSAVPEPAAMMVVGLLGCAMFTRRRRREQVSV